MLHRTLCGFPQFFWHCQIAIYHYFKGKKGRKFHTPSPFAYLTIFIKVIHRDASCQWTFVYPLFISLHLQQFRDHKATPAPRPHTLSLLFISLFILLPFLFFSFFSLLFFFFLRGCYFGSQLCRVHHRYRPLPTSCFAPTVAKCICVRS